jgi:hypothetical protein
MIFTRNIKVSVRCTDGELIFEFRRPTNKDKNEAIAASMSVKTGDDMAILEKQDEVRIGMFDRFIEGVYVEKKDGNMVVREEVTDEAGNKMDPKAFPEDVKVKAASRAFEFNTFQSKNF